jgi:hypothetical protein
MTKSQRETVDFIESQWADCSDLDYARLKFALALAWGEWKYARNWRDKINALA